MKTKTKSELVAEIVSQVRAIFQYYTDQKLDAVSIENIKRSLEENVPEEFTTEAWSEYAEVKDKEHAEQNA
jgi:hypothetical protein